MPYTTVTLRHDVARKLRAAKNPGESYGNLLGRLIDNQPAKCVEEWLKSLAPLEGRGAFMAEDRERLRADHASPRESSSRR